MADKETIAEPVEISVIYPAYNEEANLGETIRRSVEALHILSDRFEILIIDDASSDKTRQIADALAAAYPQIKVIHNAKNMGQGMSLRLGFQQVQYSSVTHNAVDYPFDLKDLGRMLPLLKQADIVVAARNSRAGYTLYRKIASIVNVTLLNFLFGLNLRDYNFVQLYRKPVLDTIRVDTVSTAFLTPEMLIRAHDLGFRIKEVAIDYHPRERGVATAGNPRVVFGSLRDMLRFWVKRAKAGSGRRRATYKD
jgi:glycosyltransferase involved in cell wall biosynthesis